jgi:hypothetical protein
MNIAAGTKPDAKPAPEVRQNSRTCFDFAVAAPRKKDEWVAVSTNCWQAANVAMGHSRWFWPIAVMSGLTSTSDIGPDIDFVARCHDLP